MEVASRGLRKGSEAGSYSRPTDFVFHSTLGLKVIKKKKKVEEGPGEEAGRQYRGAPAQRRGTGGRASAPAALCGRARVARALRANMAHIRQSGPRLSGKSP